MSMLAQAWRSFTPTAVVVGTGIVCEKCICDECVYVLLLKCAAVVQKDVGIEEVEPDCLTEANELNMDELIIVVLILSSLSTMMFAAARQASGVSIFVRVVVFGTFISRPASRETGATPQGMSA